MSIKRQIQIAVARADLWILSVGQALKWVFLALCVAAIIFVGITKKGPKP